MLSLKSCGGSMKVGGLEAEDLRSCFWCVPCNFIQVVAKAVCSQWGVFFAAVSLDYVLDPVN